MITNNLQGGNKGSEMYFIKKNLNKERKKELKNKIEELSPWYQPINFGFGVKSYAQDKNGRKYAPWNLDRGIRKWHKFICPTLPFSLKGKTVLECGCNASLFLIQALKEGAKKAYGIEIDQHYLEQAKFVRNTFSEIENKEYDIEYFKSSFDDFDYQSLEQVDVVFYFSTIYHIGRVTANDASPEDILEIQSAMLRRVAKVCKYIVFQANPLEDGGRGKGRASLLAIIDKAGLKIIAEKKWSDPRGLIVVVETGNA